MLRIVSFVLFEIFRNAPLKHERRTVIGINYRFYYQLLVHESLVFKLSQNCKRCFNIAESSRKCLFTILPKNKEAKSSCQVRVACGYLNLKWMYRKQIHENKTMIDLKIKLKQVFSLMGIVFFFFFDFWRVGILSCNCLFQPSMKRIFPLYFLLFQSHIAHYLHALLLFPIDHLPSPPPYKKWGPGISIAVSGECTDIYI